MRLGESHQINMQSPAMTLEAMHLVSIGTMAKMAQFGIGHDKEQGESSTASPIPTISGEICPIVYLDDISGYIEPGEFGRYSGSKI